MLFEDIISKYARLGKEVYTKVDFEVNPTISDRVKKVIFINEFLRNG